MSKKVKPLPTIRTVWADEVKRKIVDLQNHRVQVNAELDAEELALRSVCNHTLPDGTSAFEKDFDIVDDEYFDQCSSCGKVSKP